MINEHGEIIPESQPSTKRSPTVGELAKALALAQMEMQNPLKDSVNPFFKSKYADLATVRNCVLPVLTKHGLAVIKLPCELHGEVALTTILVHTSGEFYEATVRLRPLKNDPQSTGSAMMYMRRYALQALACVAAEDDDDGHAASRGGNSQQPARQNQSRPAPAPPVVPRDPTNGKELVDRLFALNEKLTAAGRCGEEELLQAVWEAGQEKEYPVEIADWSGPQIQFAMEATRNFLKSHPALGK